ncbi:MAG: rRNA adenine N-6-methyltransferase family protein, partial [Solirubrobacteraceae bacterium]
MSAEPPATGLPSQPSLRRMRAFGVRPKRDLGQNFLIDSNILGVIERAAELAPDDVVLEIGGGL